MSERVVSGEREGRGSGEGEREGAGGDSDAVPHYVVMEDNVVFLPYLFILTPKKTPTKYSTPKKFSCLCPHYSILRTEHPHPKWDPLPPLLRGARKASMAPEIGRQRDAVARCGTSRAGRMGRQ